MRAHKAGETRGYVSKSLDVTRPFDYLTLKKTLEAYNCETGNLYSDEGTEANVRVSLSR